MTLTLEGLLILAIVAGIAGAIGQSIAGYSHGGCLTSVALGFIGALIGSWCVRQFDLPSGVVLRVGHTNFPIIWAIVGAAVFVACLGLLTRRRYIRY
jgi:uncharacterized membrane protein YeaQ/YmgE (transglycosylase-associated protein family)